MPLDLKPHKYKTDPRTGISKLSKVVPYQLFSRLEAGGRIDIFLQNGAYYYEGGEVVPDDVLKRVGLWTDFGPDGTNIPTRIEDDPTVAAIMEAEKLDAYRMKSKPTKTIIVNSPMKGASDAS